MRAVSRLGSLWLAGALALGPATALAQQAPPPASTPPDSVGPKALQNFSLGGTVTRPSDQPASTQPPVPAARTPRAEAQAAVPTAAPRAVARPTGRTTPTQAQAAAAQPTLSRATAPAQPQPATQQAVSLAKRTADPQVSIPAVAPAFAPAPPPPGLAQSGHSYSLLLWMLEALALVAAIGFLFWRTRGREMLATSANFDLFTAPDDAPAPPPAAPPAPAPASRAAPKPPAAAPSAVVSTGLRPQVEMVFQPLRCTLDDERVVLEFDLELYNAGSAPARSVLVEARLFNAGAEQDAQILNFFANPLGAGDPIAVIPPLKRLAVRTEAVAPREQVQAYELAGRAVFVPVIAFNALYSWSGGEGQTSVSYLFGRDSNGGKLAPFRLDVGPHIFRGLAARQLPTGIRR